MSVMYELTLEGDFRKIKRRIGGDNDDEITKIAHAYAEFHGIHSFSCIKGGNFVTVEEMENAEGGEGMMSKLYYEMVWDSLTGEQRKRVEASALSGVREKAEEIAKQYDIPSYRLLRVEESHVVREHATVETIQNRISEKIAKMRFNDENYTADTLLELQEWIDKRK